MRIHGVVVRPWTNGRREEVGGGGGEDTTDIGMRNRKSQSPYFMIRNVSKGETRFDFL